MQIFISILIVVGLVYIFFLTTGYNNFRGITLELDNMYTNTSEMAYEVVDKLKKQGKDCEILELGEAYPKLLVDGKKYTLVPRMGKASVCPVQVIQLRPIK